MSARGGFRCGRSVADQFIVHSSKFIVHSTQYKVLSTAILQDNTSLRDSQSIHFTLRRNYHGSKQHKKRPVGKMLVMGLISLALYALLLARQDEGEQHVRERRLVRLPAHHHGIRIFVRPRVVHRRFLDRPRRRGRAEEKGGKVTCTTSRRVHQSRCNNDPVSLRGRFCRRSGQRLHRLRRRLRSYAGMMSLGVPGLMAVASNMCHKFPRRWWAP